MSAQAPAAVAGPSAGGGLARPGGTIDELASFLRMGEMPFGFQNTEVSTNSGIAGSVTQAGHDRGHIGAASAVNHFHDLLFYLFRIRSSGYAEARRYAHRVQVNHNAFSGLACFT